MATNVVLVLVVVIIVVVVLLLLSYWGCCYHIFKVLRLCRFSIDRYETFQTHQ